MLRDAEGRLLRLRPSDSGLWDSTTSAVNPVNLYFEQILTCSKIRKRYPGYLGELHLLRTYVQQDDFSTATCSHLCTIPVAQLTCTCTAFPPIGQDLQICQQCGLVMLAGCTPDLLILHAPVSPLIRYSVHYICSSVSPLQSTQCCDVIIAPHIIITIILPKLVSRGQKLTSVEVRRQVPAFQGERGKSCSHHLISSDRQMLSVACPCHCSLRATIAAHDDDVFRRRCDASSCLSITQRSRLFDPGCRIAVLRELML